MLDIKNVDKCYANAPSKAVNNLSISVADGEIFGFLGPNGAGKSTTIKMIVGILNIDAGQILVDGIDVTKEPILAKKSIGYVSDSHSTFDRLSGIEYLRFMGEMYDVPQRDLGQRIEKYLDVFSLTDARNDQIKTYSHGMQQKIVIAGALLHEPKLWILDEPLTGLDPESAFQLKKLMREHTQKGNTVFFSSHVIEVVEKLCDRVGIIQNGSLVTVNTLDNIRADKNISLEDVFLQATKRNKVTADEVFDEGTK